MTAPFKHLATVAVLSLALTGVANAKPHPYLRLKPANKPGPAVQVQRANSAALVQPVADRFVNADQVFAFTSGSLFQVYATVGKVTDIALQPGERLVGAGPVAAGDTARWIIGDTESGSGDTKQVHVLVKPTQGRLSTNLVINTDHRTYHIELAALERIYMASVSWRYPQDELIAVHQQTANDKSAQPLAQGIDPTKLDFNYRLDGDKVPWRPLRVFDDGRQVFIELPASISTSDLPPLFVVGPAGEAELVNYRVRDNFFIVDRLFSKGELRIGDKHSQKVVRITKQSEGRS